MNVKKLFCITLIMSLMTPTMVLGETKTSDTIVAPTWVKVKRSSNIKLKLTWQKVKDAKGYEVYRYSKKKKRYVRCKVIKGKRTTYKDKVGKHQYRRYRVRAYTRQGGKKVYSKYTYAVSARTYCRGEKKVNAGRVWTERKKITLNWNESKKVDSYVYASKYSKAKGRKPVSRKVRWRSSNPKIAKVNKKGKITAQRKEGTCTIYAIAHNGSRKAIKVKVKNFAKVKEFDYEGTQYVGEVLLRDYRKEITDIATWFTAHPVKRRTDIRLGPDGNVAEYERAINVGNVGSAIDKVVRDMPCFVTIRIYPYAVEFVMSDWQGEDYEGSDYYELSTISYSCFDKCDGEEFYNPPWTIAVAPYWLYELEPPGD